MGKDWYLDIVTMHMAQGHFIGVKPGGPDPRVRMLRRDLIKEEVEETLEALAAGDLVGIADGIADSIVVLLGTAISYGIDIRPVWDEVHRTNMGKVGGEKRSDGKQLKPEGWEPPDIAGILRSQGYEG